jgi:protein gp37
VADGSHIEWTEATWNPLVGCTKVSPGCDNCYAETLVNRFAGHNRAFPNRFDVVTMRGEKMLTQPLRWKRPRRIFVNSLSDLFHKDVPDEFIASVFAVMARAPQHTFQLLTKRHARMRALLSDDGWVQEVAEEIVAQTIEDGLGSFDPPEFGDWWPLPNVWLGVSVEDQHWANIRIPALLDTPATVRWISAEPLLGPIDLSNYLDMLWHREALDWVVVGGESGPGARPMHPQWARDIRDCCAAGRVPFLFKQWGSWQNGSAPGVHGDREHAVLLDGRHEPFVDYCTNPQSALARDVQAHRLHTPLVMANVGKKHAGRELDGRLHDGYPVQEVSA